MLEEIGILAVGIGKDVLAVLVDQAHMHVHAVSGARAVGLGHEGGGKAVLAGHTLDDALGEHDVVSRLQWIVAMQQRDFELADAVFGNRRIGRHILALAFGIDVGEEIAEVVEFVDREDGVGVEALAGIGRDRRLGIIRLGIDQIEFKLGTNDGVKPHLVILLDDSGERLARIGKKGLAAFLEHPKRHHGAGTLGPAHRHDAPARRFADAVIVTVDEDLFRANDILAPDIDADDRKRHADAAACDLVDLADRHALAAQNAVEVANDRLDALDVLIEIVCNVRVFHFGSAWGAGSLIKKIQTFDQIVKGRRKSPPR